MSTRPWYSLGARRGIVFVIVAAIVGTVAASPALAATPTVTIDPTPTAGYITAHVSGEIDPGSEDVSFYAEFRLKGSTEGWRERFIELIAANSGPTPVSADVTRLVPGTEYEFRLDAFNPATGEMVTSQEPGPSASTKAVATPAVDVDEPVDDVTSTTAHFVGQINPNAPEAAPASAEVEAAFAVNWRFECTPACPGLAGTIPADDIVHVVEADASALEPGTAYQVKLVGENAGGASTQGSAGPVNFSTPAAAPTVSGSMATSVSSDEAEIKTIINPGGAATEYHVEFGTSPSYGASTPESSVGDDNEAHELSAELGGLLPGATYHWRVVATNDVKATLGPDHTFTTFLGLIAGGLPDGRAYEQATPVDKNGQPAQGYYETGLPQASIDGGAVTFRAESGFPGAEGGQEIGEFVATRSADGSGWSSRGLYPPATTGNEALVLGWSEDLSKSYSDSRFIEVGGDPGTDFRLLERSTATGAVTPITEFADAAHLPPIAAAPGGGARVLFQTEASSAVGGEPQWEVALWNAASQNVTKVSVFNNGTEPPEGALAGRPITREIDPRSPSDDPLSANGRDAFFTSFEQGRLREGQLFLRTNIEAPQSPIGSGGECLDTTAACTIEVSASQRSASDPDGPKPASFAGAARNTSKAYFTSSAKLTDDATTGPADGGSDLYAFEPAEDRLVDLTPDGTDPDGAEVLEVLGASEDGATLYFVANGVLAANAGVDGTHATLHQGACNSAAQAQCNLYVWNSRGTVADGQIEYIGGLVPPGGGVAVKTRTRVSADGEVLLFASSHEIDGYDNAGTIQFYRLDRHSGILSCVTCLPTGAAPFAPATLQSIVAPGQTFAGPGVTQSQPRNLSSNGNRVFFETPNQLVEADVNGLTGCPATIAAGDGSTQYSCLDVYEWEAPGEGTCTSSSSTFSGQDGGCLYLISTGTSSEPAYFGDASANGNDAFFFTGQSLVGQDKDSLTDIYDARVGGGIAAQNPPTLPRCESAEACSGAGADASPALAPSTPNFSGSGNEQPHKHKKHKHKHKKHKHKKHNHKKHKQNGKPGNSGKKTGGK